MTAMQIKTREEMDSSYQWDLSTMFASDEAHQAAFEEIEGELEGLAKYQGQLASSGETLAEAIDTMLDLNRRLSHVYVYAHLRNDQDQGNEKYQQMEARCSSLYSKFKQATSFFEPELMAIPESDLEEMIQQNERLGELTHYIDNLTRGRAHVLSPELELVLANAHEIFGSASKTFGVLTNADMEFPTIQDEYGNEVTLTHSIYGKLLESTDRRVRKDNFEQFYSVFKQFRNTLAQTLSTNIKVHNYDAKTRGFKTAREQALFENNVPESVYDTLLEAVGSRVELLHRYVALRKQLLDIEDLEMYDLYTPLLGEPPIAFTYEEAKEITMEALKPMGEDYMKIIQAAFDEAWIDVYENKGKRSGAYSSGSYDSKPYILLNWQDGLNWLYTLVHELGHSVHSYYTRENQPVEYGGYPIFLAEIASTTNENLLTDYLLKKYDDVEIQRYIINNFLDGMKGTVFRQTQFAEFEHFMYQQDAAGQPLTADYLSEHYQKLNEKFYGPEVNSDSEIKYEWSRIPHFYYNYYVFQYSTGFAAATFFASKILAGDTEARKKYLNFLKSGSSHYPIDTMKQAGLDMTERDYIDATLDVFEQRLNEFEALLEK